MAAEHALPSALAHFDPADLLDALSTGIVMLDAQLCAMYANVAAQDLLAFSLNQARGRPFSDFLHDANGLPAILRRALATGEGIADRELVVRPGGRAARDAHPGRDHHAARRPHRARTCCSSSPTPRSGSASRARPTCWRASTAAA